ncbi:hypothetical protein NQ318_016539 [Aromia moschata]|uniref:Uncharacterized protein n=1 Tax=Aromia moschata TaxID=1265417 RepID=A0AAV8YZB7_9CUCU|nr:hypothetical protein NQ318_016539 [Aromia moschata]
MPMMMPVYHVMTSQPQYQAPPQGNRIKRIPMSQMRTDMASQMQVAAATGSPLLAPAPLQQFIYPPSMNQAYQPMHTAVRMLRHLATDPVYTSEPAPIPDALPPLNPTNSIRPRDHRRPRSSARQLRLPQGHHQFPADVPHHTQRRAAHDAEHAVPAAGSTSPQHPMPVLMHQHPGQGNPHGPNP